MTERPTSGLVVVDKPGGMTSHDVVAKARRSLGTRKVGHAGTLDPMATGVLVLGFGRATRLLGHLMLTEKSYDATVRLGVATTTDDAEGEVVSTTSAAGLTEEQVRAALAAFVGDIQQVPSAVSAIKVDGQRAYKLAREGEQVELAARPVTVHEIEVRGFETVAAQPPQPADQPAQPPRPADHPAQPPQPADHTAEPPQPAVADLRISVRCSSGTYIRAIARDLGAALGVGGHLTELRRTAVGPFTLEGADTDPSDLQHLLPIADAARAAFPAYDLDDGQAAAVRVGRPLQLELATTTAVFAPGGEFLALYAPRDGLARPVAVFV